MMPGGQREACEENDDVWWSTGVTRTIRYMIWTSLWIVRIVDAVGDDVVELP